MFLYNSSLFFFSCFEVQRYNFNSKKGKIFCIFYLQESEKRSTFATVIELDRHIEILLLSNDCVIVPGLGGFMAHHVDARFDEADGTFLPPLRTLGFNPRLTMNDSLLVQSYIEAFDISYPEALRRIEAEVEELRQHLESEDCYELNGLGTLRLNSDGNLEFEPCEAGILTPNLYGLSTFELMPLATEEPKATDSNEETLDETVLTEEPADSAITIKMSWLRNAVAVAAAVLAFFMISTPISNNNATLDVQQSAFFKLPQHHASQDDDALNPSTSATDSTTCQEESIKASEDIVEETIATTTYTIVMASQVTQRNAEIFIAQLNKAEYTKARLQTSSKTNMLRVVYGTYNSQEEAIDSLRSLRKQSKQFSDAWVLEVK